jgi:hypothetical protein
MVLDAASGRLFITRSTGASRRGLGDLNPIEMAFSKLKALIRRAAARTYDHLWRAVGHVCDLFTDEECYNFFKAAGYETN